ncbi:MAG TPA: phospholipase D-like domain-containing protein [Terriglobales bacterium]
MQEADAALALGRAVCACKPRQARTGAFVNLLIQPGDSVGPLIRGIEKARKSVEIVIFRFDRIEIERALKEAAKRGVFVHALIAYTNRGGEKNLRKLEMRFLAAGITVARTSDDLVRYHGKMMLVDRKQLYVFGFNFTHLDIERSRSFGIVTSRRLLVQEAIRLFECDTKRQVYSAGHDNFLVSPVNARRQLANFIKGARKELLIYDLKITDRAMRRLLEDRARAGVEVRIIGKITGKTGNVTVRKLHDFRLHTRTIVRDRRRIFIGSQSLRELELDARREIGVILNEPKVVNGIVKVFEEDWNQADVSKAQSDDEAVSPAVDKAAKQVAKDIARKLPPVGPVVEKVIEGVTRGANDIDVDHKEIEETVKGAVKAAVREAVQEVIEEIEDRRETR